MAKIFPFKGIRYNINKIGDLSKVVTPPYDVISKQAQQCYYESSSYNIIRLILNKELPDDNEKNNRYTRALDFFKKWQEDEILIEDKEASFYLYEQEFSYKDKKRIRCGFIARLELSDFAAKEIFPHEKTFAKPKLDRLTLIETCKANFSPVFGLYYEKEPEIKKLLLLSKEISVQIINIADEFKIVHRVWQIKDKSLIDKIAEQFKDKQIFIADGHHRYEASLIFRDQMRKKQSTLYTGKESYNYVMIYLTNLDEEGIAVLPTHRLIRTLPDDNLPQVIQKIKQSFNIEFVENKDKMLSELNKYNEKSKYIFGMYYYDINDKKGRFSVLTLNDEKIINKIMDKTKSDKYNKLNVTVLHSLVIDKILSLHDKIHQDNIGYTQNEDEAIGLINEGKYKIGFFINPTRIDELKNIALSGGLMPQKSTYFYPKLETGLVINKL